MPANNIQLTQQQSQENELKARFFYPATPTEARTLTHEVQKSNKILLDEIKQNIVVHQW